MKKLVFGILVIILLIGIAGCGANGGVARPPAITASPDYAGVNSMSTSSKDYHSEAVTPTLIPATTTTMAVPQPTVITAGQTPSDYQQDIQRMVIRNAALALVVENIDTSIQQITNLADSNGGYVINSNIMGDQNRLYGSISIRVDANKFDATLQALKLMAVDVRSETTSGQDVTEEYVDLDAQLRNLQASETQLLALMDKAGSVEEILKVQQQLTSTRGQIEQLQGRMQYLRQSAALSSISVSLEQSKLALEFSATATTVKQNDQIQFIPSVSGGFAPYSYEWNFGDGKTSTEAAPVHTYTKAGTYTVKLTVKDDKGGSIDATREDYVTVLDNSWKAGNVAGSAWNGLAAFWRFTLSVIIWLGILSPIWIIILVILYFTIWRKRKKKS